MEAPRRCKASGSAVRNCRFVFVITVFSHQEVRESVYRAGRGCRVQTGGVVLQERDNCVGIYVGAAKMLMTCQGKLGVTACVGCLVVTASEALRSFRSSGYDKVAQPAEHRERGVSKFRAPLFQMYFRILCLLECIILIFE